MATPQKIALSKSAIAKLLCWGLGALSAVACSPTLSTVKPARLVPPGHLQVASSVDVSLPSGAIKDAFDAIQNVSSVGVETIDSEDAATIVEAASYAVVQPLALSYQLSMDYGFSKWFSADLRASLTAARIGARFQFLRIKPGIYGAVGLGGSAYYSAFPIGAVTNVARLASHERYEIDVPVQLGFSSRAFHFWVGPKLVWATYNAEVGVCLETDSTQCTTEALMAMSGTATYLGGQAGIAVGYRDFWVALEITMARADVGAQSTLSAQGQSASFDLDTKSFVAMPSIGVILWF